LTDLIAKAALILAMGVWHPAWGVRYDPGVFERTARIRGMSVVPCMAAHHALPLGTWIEVEGPAGKARARITDTSQPWDAERHRRLKRMEFSYACSKRICGQFWSGAAVECPISWRTLRR
jgi:hypothetical protein